MWIFNNIYKPNQLSLKYSRLQYKLLAYTSKQGM